MKTLDGECKNCGNIKTMKVPVDGKVFTVPSCNGKCPSSHRGEKPLNRFKRTPSGGIVLHKEFPTANASARTGATGGPVSAFRKHRDGIELSSTPF